MLSRTLSLIVILIALSIAGCRRSAEVTETPEATETEVVDEPEETPTDEPEEDPTPTRTATPEPEVEEEEEQDPTPTPTEAAVEPTAVPPTEVTEVQSIPIELQEQFCSGIVSDAELEAIFQLAVVERTTNAFDQSGSVTLCQYRFSNNSGANFAARLFSTPDDAQSFYETEQAFSNALTAVQPIDGNWRSGFFSPSTVTLHFVTDRSYGVVEYVTAEEIDLGPPLYAFAQTVASGME